MSENDLYRKYSGEFGKRLLQAREKFFLSQRDFAARLNITASYVCDMEKGKTKPGFDFIVEVSRVFKLSVSWLIMGWGEMFGNRIANEREKNLIDQMAKGDKDVKNFLWYFRNSPLVKHTVMGFTLKFMHDNKDIIERDLEMNKEISAQK